MSILVKFTAGRNDECAYGPSPGARASRPLRISTYAGEKLEAAHKDGSSNPGDSLAVRQAGCARINPMRSGRQQKDQHDPKTRKKAGRGHTLIELSMLSVLFVVIGVLGLDVGYLIMGSELNDRACRDAARAAAEADNYVTSLQLAQAAVIAHAGDGVYVTSPKVDTSVFTYQDFGGSPPSNISPYVSVTTHCNINVPAPIFFLGSSFLAAGKMQFSKTYVFPIVKTSLYLP